MSCRANVSKAHPYMPLEAEYNLTGRALQVIAHSRFPVHILTKSDLVLRDLEVIQEINKVFAAVSFTITTVDDELASKLEPGSPSPSRRLNAMRKMAEKGIHTGVLLMPVLPYIEDSEENITQIVQQASENGAAYILPSFGMSLRDRQREYYYRKLDVHFPGLRQQYEGRYGRRYHCAVPNGSKLTDLFKRQCSQAGVATRMPIFDDSRVKAEQPRLF